MKAAPALLLGPLALVLASVGDDAERAPGPAPRLDAWQVLGPGGGGTMRRPAISPHDPDRVVLGCDMTGAYITQDGGLSWRLFHLSGVVSAFAFDPSAPNVIYAGNAALWRSEDGGRRWSLVFPDPARGTVRHGWSDHGDTVFTTEDASYPSGLDVDVEAVAVDPADSKRLAIALRSTLPGPPGSNPSSAARVLVSEDRGRSFKVRATLEAERVFTIVFEHDGTINVVAESGVYLLGDVHAGSHETTRRQPGPSGGRIESASVAAADGTTLIYATTRASWTGGRAAGGIHVSEDGGATWRSANGGLGEGLRGADTGAAWGPATGSRPGLGPIAASARHGRVAYVGFRGLRLPGADGQANGIAKTTDGGRTWQIVHREADRPSTNLDPSWIEARAVEDGHSVWFDAPYDLAVAPGEPDVAYATDLFRTYRTSNGGKTWAQVNSARRGEDRWTSRGLDVTTNYGVHWDPFDARRIFVGWTDIGLFRSEDGGETWTGSSHGIPKEWRNTAYWMELDPEVRGLAWGAFSGTHDLPRPKMWRRTDPARYRGGVAISRDGGRTWTPSNTGLPESAITHLLLDPTSPAGRRRLWATAFGRGVYRSDDDGRTWALKNTGIEGAQPFAWRISRTAEGTLYLVVARRSERGRIGDAGDGALYRSTDGGESWARMALPAGTNGPNALTPDPLDPRRLYLSSWGVATPGGDTGGGIFLSTDTGETWRNVLPESQHVYDVTLDPSDPAVLYACGFDQAAWRSKDRGETWSRLRGFNFQWGHRVVPDRADPARIYVTTFGGSLWRGPAEGDPQAPEDVVPWGGTAHGATMPTPSPDGAWSRFSPRPALAPGFAIDGATLVLTGRGERHVLGGWRRTFDGVSAGVWYRLSASVETSGLPSLREGLAVLLHWRGPGVGEEIAPEYADHVTTSPDGSVRLEGRFEAPQGATAAEVSVLLQGAPGATVRVHSVALDRTTAPPPRPVRVATVYWRPSGPSTPDANVAAFAALVDRAAATRPDVVVLPEAITSIGTALSVAEAAQEREGTAFRVLSAAARRHRTHVIYGAYEKDGALVFNSAHVIGRDGALLRSYRKVQLPVGEVEAGLSAGDAFEAFDLDFGRVGILICHDTAFDEPVRVLALQGAEVVFVPTWGGVPIQFRARALDHGLWVVTSGYDVPSAVFDPSGEVRAETWKEPAGGVASFTIDLGRRVHRPWVGDWGRAALKQRRTDAYRGLIEP